MNIYVFYGFIAFLCIINQIFCIIFVFYACTVLCEKCRLHKTQSMNIYVFYGFIAFLCIINQIFRIIFVFYALYCIMWNV